MLMKKQKGIALIVGLIVLLVLTVAATALLQSSATEEKISANLRDMNVALQSAETALRQGENFVEGLTSTINFGSSAGLYLNGTAPNPFTASTWSGSGVITVTGSLGSIQTPQYFIELLGSFYQDPTASMNVFNYGQNSSPLSTVFRIVARGTGAAGTSQVILESFYAKAF
jgi:type IV pilus assembly protein PilX